jgi:uncharacterized 2Fe-2S/4Fe-4S cluster protein (DUF4445 family)
MAPRRKSNDTGSASKPKRRHDVLSISQKVKILDMIAIGKKTVCGDCPVLWQERIFHSRSDEEQRKKFALVSLLRRKLQK